MTVKLTRRAVVSGAIAATALPRTASADWKPAETVRIIVPAAPGGTTDVMGRLLAQHLQVAWGQSTIVENKSGGGGTIAMTDFIRQKADGHTIMMGNPGPNAIAYRIFRNLTYKPEQLQPVSNMIRTSNIVSAHPSVPVKSIPELIGYLKKNPDTVSYATSGTGQSPHLTAAWFLQLTGLKMTHVPFRGAGPAITAALGGQVQILFDNLFPSLPQVREGKLTGLATTMPERTPLSPDIPTMRESAPELASFDVSSWFGVFLPGGTPRPVVDSLNGEIKALLARDDMKARIRDLGAIADYTTPEQYAAFVQAEIAKFGEIIAREKLQMDVN
ncbi:MAG: tripartite tricarboxylate transporter substrate binding protein [Xanthobacteraceae bacterium]